ncbi:MAG TPA: hypothetical protein VGK90_11725 [Rhizomicrobium sp.]
MKNVGSFMDELLSHLKMPLDIELLFTCREHFSRAASLYNNRIRTPNSPEQRSPDEFLNGHGHKICYAPLVQNLRKTGHRVTALNYHPSDEWVKRFFTHIGFAEQDIPSNKAVLIAYSPRMLIALLAAKRVVKSPKKVSALIKQFDKQMPRSREPSRFIFSPEAARQAEERHYAADRKFLKDEFNIDLTPPDLSTQTCEFFISDEELGQIAAAASKFGSQGKALVDFARQYVGG